MHENKKRVYEYISQIIFDEESIRKQIRQISVAQARLLNSSIFFFYKGIIYPEHLVPNRMDSLTGIKQLDRSLVDKFEKVLATQYAISDELMVVAITNYIKICINISLGREDLSQLLETEIPGTWEGSTNKIPQSDMRYFLRKYSTVRNTLKEYYTKKFLLEE